MTDVPRFAESDAGQHDPRARECVVVGWPTYMLHDGPCPACRAVSALVDLDPEFGSASEGRPRLRCEYGEFTEDVNDASMCMCGVPALTHEQVYPTRVLPPADRSET